MGNFLRIATIIILFGMTVGIAVAQPEPLTEWHQGFESGTDGWITDSTPGEDGWCGEIERRDASSGSVEPSEGEGYAVVTHGPCNAYWAEVFAGMESETGPYSAGHGYPSAWPDAGYVSELDVYLDPEGGTEFTLAGSVVLLEPAAPGSPIRYFFVGVMPEGDGLSVLGQDVTAAGWYTLRYTYGDENGSLTVDAELLRDGEVVASAPLTTTAFSGEAASSFDVTNLGTGYTWFASIGEGTEIPIDEHRVRTLD